MNVQALPYVTTLGFLFGSTLVASRFSVGQYHPTTYLGLRLVLAALGHVLIYAVVSRQSWPRDLNLWRHGIVLGIIGTAVPMTAIISSLQYQSSGVTSLLLTTSPAITVVLAHLLLPDEFLTRRKIIGVTLALGGAVMLAARGENGLGEATSGSLQGYGLVAIAIVASTSMTIYARKYMSEFDAFDVGSVRMLTAAVVVLPLSLLIVGFDVSGVDGRGYGALVYAAVIGTFSGMLLAFYNIKRFGATSAVMSSYIVPIVAGLGGVLVLEERISVTMVVGMIVIIAGIATIQQRVSASPQRMRAAVSAAPVKG